MKLLVAFCLFLANLAGADLSLVSAERIEIDGGFIAVGSSMPDVMKVLGSKARIYIGPKKATGEQLAAERRSLASAVPWDSAAIEYLYSAIGDCSACWIAGVEKKLADKTTVRVILKGTSKADLSVVGLLIDSGHFSTSNALRRAFEDARTGVRYYVTEDGAYRVSVSGRVATITSLNDPLPSKPE